jgi:hypothetical protein
MIPTSEVLIVEKQQQPPTDDITNHNTDPGVLDY